MQYYTKNYVVIYLFYFLGETMGGVNQYDEVYRRVCHMYNEQRAIYSTVLGDSHGVRLYRSLSRSFDASPYSDFLLAESNAIGGAKALTCDLSRIQRDDGTDVVILWIQGNDLDEHTTEPQWYDYDRVEEYIRDHATRGIFRIFLELTVRLNKIVYVILLPTRFRTSRAILYRYQAYCRRLNNILRKYLGSRVITLDPRCYRINVFRDQIHLTDDWYEATAIRVHQQIRRDLQGSRTLPRDFMPRLLRWMRRHGWE